jgi:hypothetical protein
MIFDLLKNFKEIYLTEADEFNLIKSSASCYMPQPYLISNAKSNKIGWLVSSIHGRSIISSYDGKYYTILKGIGLTYTNKSFVNISEFKYGHIWGALSKKDAIREFEVGNSYKELGGNSAHYDYVIKINSPITNNLVGLKKITPFLLQYRIECPIRVSDFGLNDKRTMVNYLKNVFNNDNPLYLNFTKKCLDNLTILHNNSFFYNALNVYNTTLIGEFVDFESSFSKSLYCPKEGFSIYQNLIAREIINLLQVVTVFADLVGEKINHKVLNKEIKHRYIDNLLNNELKKYHSKLYQLIS